MLVDKIKNHYESSKIEFQQKGPDPRNYRVDFSKAKNKLKFIPKYSIEDGILEIKDYLNSNTFKINFLYRELDQNSWQYCNKGFFNFKNYIPKIISTLN